MVEYAHGKWRDNPLEDVGIQASSQAFLSVIFGYCELNKTMQTSLAAAAGSLSHLPAQLLDRSWCSACIQE